MKCCTRALFIDDVPVLFGGPGAHPDQAGWFASLGGRILFGRYCGEFPLQGELLRRSLALYDEIVPCLPKGVPARRGTWDGAFEDYDR